MREELDFRERELKKRERKAERDLERAMRLEVEMDEERKQIDLDKEAIKRAKN